MMLLLLVQSFAAGFGAGVFLCVWLDSRGDVEGER